MYSHMLHMILGTYSDLYYSTDTVTNSFINVVSTIN